MTTKRNQFKGKQQQAAGIAGITGLVLFLVLGIAIEPIFSDGVIIGVILGPLIGAICAAITVATMKE